eukprot:Rhum_TRINITY_DN14266_c3_g1::Rhum_TRINITY_DN14266_c3_g1_i1::g.78863::m.78863
MCLACFWLYGWGYVFVCVGGGGMWGVDRSPQCFDIVGHSQDIRVQPLVDLNIRLEGVEVLQDAPPQQGDGALHAVDLGLERLLLQLGLPLVLFDTLLQLHLQCEVLLLALLQRLQAGLDAVDRQVCGVEVCDAAARRLQPPLEDLEVAQEVEQPLLLLHGQLPQRRLHRVGHDLECAHDGVAFQRAEKVGKRQERASFRTVCALEIPGAEGCAVCGALLLDKPLNAGVCLSGVRHRCHLARPHHLANLTQLVRDARSLHQLRLRQRPCRPVHLRRRQVRQPLSRALLGFEVDCLRLRPDVVDQHRHLLHVRRQRRRQRVLLGRLRRGVRHLRLEP